MLKQNDFRITRLGCLAVHLMPRYHGKALERAVLRIMAKGPRDKHEREAVRRANADECGNEPMIRTTTP